MTIARHVKHAGLALIALSSVGVLQGAYANGTASGTTISNQATVDYSVGGVSQTQITSAAASFVVDSRDRLHCQRRSAPTRLRRIPGQINVVTTFRVTNTGNSTQGYVLTIANEATARRCSRQTDNQDVNNLRIVRRQQRQRHVRSRHRHCDEHQLADHGPDGVSVVVFVLADIPVGATNNQYANVRLHGRRDAASAAPTPHRRRRPAPTPRRGRRRVGGRGPRQLRVGRRPVRNPVGCADDHQDRGGDQRSVQRHHATRKRFRAR